MSTYVFQCPEDRISKRNKVESHKYMRAYMHFCEIFGCFDCEQLNCRGPELLEMQYTSVTCDELRKKHVEVIKEKLLKEIVSVFNESFTLIEEVF